MPNKVLAFHLIMTAYGFWLPNDPRGSWSEIVRAWELVKFGPATKVTTRKSLAHRPHDQQLRLAAKKAMVREPVKFDGLQARAIGRGFGEFAMKNDYAIHACSILPTHVHMVLANDGRDIRQVSRLLKGAATTELTREGLHPFAGSPFTNGRLPTPWTRHEWVCYLYEPHDVRRAIHYVNENPIKENMKAQKWSFVTDWRDHAI